MSDFSILLRYFSHKVYLQCGGMLRHGWVFYAVVLWPCVCTRFYFFSSFLYCIHNFILITKIEYRQRKSYLLRFWGNCTRQKVPKWKTARAQMIGVIPR